MSKYANLPEDMKEELARHLLEMRLNDTVDERNRKLQLLQRRIDRNEASARTKINDGYDTLFWPHGHFLRDRNYAEQGDMYDWEWTQFLEDYYGKREFWRYMKYAKKLKEENEQLRAQIEELEQHIKEKKQAKEDVRLATKLIGN